MKAKTMKAIKIIKTSPKYIKQNYNKAIFAIERNFWKEMNYIKNKINIIIKLKNPLKQINFLSPLLYQTFTHSLLNLFIDIKQLKSIIARHFCGMLNKL